MERSGWKPNDDHHHICPNCPRCGCSNTKFCYYNNYSLTQPRYFCKGCRRYWTKGGSLRNVPVGGGCRKNRRGSRSLRLSTNTTTANGSNNVHSGTIGHINAYGSSSSLAPESTTSQVSNQDAPPRIDLAVVYANFLNQKPDSKSSGSDQLPELPGEFDVPGFDFSSCIANMNINAGSGSNIQMMEENGLIGSIGCQSSVSENCGTINDHMYFGGLDPLIDHHQKHQDHISDLQYASSTHESTDFGLPPLPDQEVLWSSSDHQMMVSPIMQPTSVLGSEAHHDPNLLNWSPVFDLPCNGTFSRT